MNKNNETDMLKNIIKNNMNIKCVFVGHKHVFKTTIMSDEWRNLPMIYCGDYSYSKNRADKLNPWSNRGYVMLDLNDDISINYIKSGECNL